MSSGCSKCGKCYYRHNFSHNSQLTSIDGLLERELYALSNKLSMATNRDAHEKLCSQMESRSKLGLRFSAVRTTSPNLNRRIKKKNLISFYELARVAKVISGGVRDELALLASWSRKACWENAEYDYGRNAETFSRWSARRAGSETYDRGGAGEG